MATRISPYLLFPGTCREALSFYAEIFDGKVELFTAGGSGMDLPEAMHDRITHGEVKTDAFTIMACDELGQEKRLEGSNAVSLSVHPESVDEGRRIIDALAAGGEVLMKYEKQFWGDTFGMAIDKYGMRWMVNVVTK